MAREISTNGKKKVSTLMQEFNQNFSYLMLIITEHPSDYYTSRGLRITDMSVDLDKTLSEIRKKKGEGEIRFTASKLISTIEHEFEKAFGLYAQVCYVNAKNERCTTADISDKKSLNQLNREKEMEGCIKGVWK
jgi:hypothetical protein